MVEYLLTNTTEPSLCVYANVERDHYVTKEQAISFVKNVKFWITGWKGKNERYFGFEGAAYVDVETYVITTAFAKRQFDDKVKDALRGFVENGGR